MRNSLNMQNLTVMIFLFFWALSIAQSRALLNEFAGGSGTEADPWQIATAEHLNNVRNYLGDEHNDKYYLQISDIELGIPPWNEGEGWVATGSYNFPFCGHYNGNGFLVTGMLINRPTSSYQGLFGYTKGAVIENLGVDNVDVTGDEYVGALVGYNYDDAIINNCFSNGSVNGNSYTGGLIGHNSYSSVSSCFSMGTVTGSQSNCGGLIGLSTYQALSNSYSRAEIQGNISVGGLVGYQFRGTMINCYAAGPVSGSQYVGGLTGRKITLGGFLDINNYWDTEASGQSSSAMGLGRTTAEMTYPYNQETFIDWDFSEIWGVDLDFEFNEGYPYLRGVGYVSAEETVIVLPEQFQIVNYPNPFNPETTIRFELQERGEVELEVFNIKGQKVKLLLREMREAGEEKIVWDGCDDRGKEMPSGVYFYRLVTSRDVVSGKMLLLK